MGVKAAVRADPFVTDGVARGASSAVAGRVPRRTSPLQPRMARRAEAAVHQAPIPLLNPQEQSGTEQAEGNCSHPEATEATEKNKSKSPWPPWLWPLSEIDSFRMRFFARCGLVRRSVCRTGCETQLNAPELLASGAPFTDFCMRQRTGALARFLGAGVLCWIALRVVVTIRYPFGGGEFHAIFAYPTGSFDTAWGVFLTYLATSVAIAALLVVTGYRISWWAIAAVASLVCLHAWWQVCSFEYSFPEVRDQAMRLLPVIPVLITVVAYLAHRGRDVALRYRRAAASG